MSEMERIFNKSFERFQIYLPSDDLDYYSSHRMVGDDHIRIYADGTTESLPALCSFYTMPAGCTPEQEKRIREEYAAKNRQIAEELEEKGFGLEGDEPGGVDINRYLTLNDVEK